MKTIDYYNYWNKKRQKGLYLWDREKKALKLLSRVVKSNSLVLDAGCANGRFMRIMQKAFENRNIRVKGLEYSKIEVKEALKEKLDVKHADFEQGIKMKDKSIDVVYSGEVIEHLYNPDLFLSEVNRILKKGGYFVFATPNLLAWFNRILVPLGIQPLFIEPSTKSKLVGAGFLARFKKESQPVGHVRIFTLKALRDMLEMNGFEVLDIKGALFDEVLPKSILLIDRIFNILPGLSSNLVILARKIR